MNRPFECPDCHTVHDEPAQAPVGIVARCLDCELEMSYRADRDAAAARGFELVARAA